MLRVERAVPEVSSNSGLLPVPATWLRRNWTTSPRVRAFEKHLLRSGEYLSRCRLVLHDADNRQLRFLARELCALQGVLEFRECSLVVYSCSMKKFGPVNRCVLEPNL